MQKIDKQIKKEIDDGIIASARRRRISLEKSNNEINYVRKKLIDFVDKLSAGDNAGAGEAFKDALRAKVADGLDKAKS